MLRCWDRQQAVLPVLILCFDISAWVPAIPSLMKFVFDTSCRVIVIVGVISESIMLICISSLVHFIILFCTCYSKHFVWSEMFGPGVPRFKPDLDAAAHDEELFAMGLKKGQRTQVPHQILLGLEELIVLWLFLFPKKCQVASNSNMVN